MQKPVKQLAEDGRAFDYIEVGLRDIALANRKNLAKSVDGFIAELEKFQAALKAGDAVAVESFFATAKQRRDGWCAGCAAPASE